MSSTVNITVHASQFPDSVERSFREGLRTRRIAPKFLYQTYRQSELWLALHRAYSPAVLDPDCERIYDRAFEAAANLANSKTVGVIGLGVGSGAKEYRLIKCLKARQTSVAFVPYVPSDVSLPLLLTATPAEPAARPLLCDFSEAEDMPAVLDTLLDPAIGRIITFFGLIPNFRPEAILPKLANVQRPNDILLFSANLAPGPDYRAGVQKVFSGYDNAHTRAWLISFMEDLGIRNEDGQLQFSIDDTGPYLCIAADFKFRRQRSIVAGAEEFIFENSACVRLFSSYRYAPATIRQLLQKHGIEVREQWVTKSEEEGVFLCGKV